MLAAAHQLFPPGHTWNIVIALTCIVAVLGASSFVFVAIVRRWTHHRRWTELYDWGAEHGFRLRRDALVDDLPEIMREIPGVRASIVLHRHDTWIAQVETPGSETEPPARWNLLAREMEAAWPPTALRPAQLVASAVDLYRIPTLAALSSGERFLVQGIQHAAARSLSRSTVPGLLPGDVGMVLKGKYLLLDFSTRPYDSIEFNRMAGVMAQVIERLPTVKAV